MHMPKEVVALQHIVQIGVDMTVTSAWAVEITAQNKPMARKDKLVEYSWSNECTKERMNRSISQNT